MQTDAYLSPMSHNECSLWQCFMLAIAT